MIFWNRGNEHERDAVAGIQSQRGAEQDEQHAALRALANRWLEIMWHCLRKGVRYDETVHTHNRSQALQPPTAA